MVRRLRVLAVATLILLGGSLCLADAAQKRGPSTAEERARAVQIAHKLRSDPLALDVQSEREWLIRWLIEVPDISVKLCTTFLGDLGNSKKGYPGEIIASMMASQAAFAIEHPEKVKDDDAVYLAGVEGALQTYQSIHSKDPKYKLAKLESLIQMRDQGKLADFVHETAKQCVAKP